MEITQKQIDEKMSETHQQEPSLKRAYIAPLRMEILGTVIPKGTVFRECKKDKDWFIPTVIGNDRIPMTCPNLMAHFTTLGKGGLIESYV